MTVGRSALPCCSSCSSPRLKVSEQLCMRAESQAPLPHIGRVTGLPSVEDLILHANHTHAEKESEGCYTFSNIISYHAQADYKQDIGHLPCMSVVHASVQAPLLSVLP